MGGLPGGLPGNLDFNNLGDNELQSLLNNMDQRQLMQVTPKFKGQSVATLYQLFILIFLKWSLRL